MLRNGTYFLSVVKPDSRQPGVWDPSIYRSTTRSSRLDEFVSIRRLSARRNEQGVLRFAPIEYRHIHSGALPIFALECIQGIEPMRFPSVPEGTLLFGTMRAYLGNVLVTPSGSWLGETHSLLFPVKSEFVEIIPFDGLVYFWRSFFRSSKFLSTLPAGGGGTRPRLESTALASTSIEIPELVVREEIHQNMLECSRRAWSDYIRAADLLKFHALQ